MINPKNINKEVEIISSFDRTKEDPTKFSSSEDSFEFYKEHDKFIIKTDKSISNKSSDFRFESLDNLVLKNSDKNIKVVLSNIRRTEGYKINYFHISKFCSENFQEDVKLKYKLIIPYHKKIEIHYQDFFSNFEFMTYINSDVFGGIEFKIKDCTFEIYHLDSFFVVECSDKIDYTSFDKYCRIALASFGFVTGFVPMDSGYYFGYENDEYVQFLSSTTFYDTYKTQYSLLTTNAYEYYQNKDLDFSYEEGKFLTYKNIEALEQKLKSITKDNFEKLINSMLKNDKFSEVIFSLLAINNLKSFSAFLKAGLYSIVLEMITSIITKENKSKKVENEEILQDKYKTKREELQKKLNEIAQNFYTENSMEYENSVVAKNLNKIYNPFNIDKLLEPYILLGITLNEQEKKNVNLRNKFLHGSMPYKDKDYKVLSSKLLYINLELNYLVNALIFKYIGYDGVLKNLSKMYLDYFDLKELSNEEYYKDNSKMDIGV